MNNQKSPNANIDNEFFSKLRIDLDHYQQRRFQLQLTKVTSIGTLISAGVLLIQQKDLSIIFYVIPFISFAFDLMIISMSFSIKRLSSFISYEKKNVQDVEYRWEAFVKSNPDRLASYANYLLSVLITLGCVAILIFTQSPIKWLDNVYNVLWLLIVMFILMIYFFIERQPRKKVWNFIDNKKQSGNKAS